MFNINCRYAQKTPCKTSIKNACFLKKNGGGEKEQKTNVFCSSYLKIIFEIFIEMENLNE